MEVLQVKRLTSLEEVFRATEKRVSGNYRPGEQDHRIFFELDPTGFYAGLLGPDIVGCMCVLRHCEKFYFVGYYFVCEGYRGRGFGRQMWSKVMDLASLPQDCNIGLVSSIAQQPIYEKLGFKMSWLILNSDVHTSEALLSLSKIQESPITQINTKKITGDTFESIVEYDAQAYGFSRRVFLDKWLFASNCHSFVAQETGGKVVGYATVRRTLNEREGWKIGPLFADDTETAIKLYKAVFDAVTATHKNALVRVTTPCANAAAVQIFRAVTDRGTERENFVRMYTGGVPLGTKLDKIFVHTAVEIY